MAMAGSKAKPIPKTWKFYRRTGAIWTDHYHTPYDRLKMAGYRPDLDASESAGALCACASEAAHRMNDGIARAGDEAGG